jgi:hypothetical protein
MGLLSTAPLGAQGVRVSRVGSPRDFGPGILQATPGRLAYQLMKSAHVIVLQLDAQGAITPVYPVDTAGSFVDVGVHVLTTAVDSQPDTESPVTQRRLASAQELARTGQAVRPPAVAMEDRPPVGYWLLILSDSPTTMAELRRQLEALTLDFRSVDDELRSLPKMLVGGRSKTWGAYYAAVY